MSVTVGPVDLGTATLLAPMEAVTDLPFRTICEEQGASLSYTEFLSAEALTRGAAKAIGRMWPSLQGRRFAVQIFGRDPNVLARAAEMAVNVGASILDINMGCPAKRVTSGLCGSALMREPDLAAQMVRTIRNVLPTEIPVTVKHRLGWDDSSINAPEFACRMVDAGAALITVHGRTRSQGFSGQARLDEIAAVRAAVPRHIPVIGNGDVKTVDEYSRMKSQTGVDGVMIGRGAMGNPWLFRSIAALEAGRPDPGPPTLEERHTIWRRHVDLLLQYVVPRMHVHEIKKTIAWYSRGLRGGADLRQKGQTIKDPQILREHGEAFFSGLRMLELQGDGRPMATIPADPVTKSIARNFRRDGMKVEAPEPFDYDDAGAL